MEGFGGVFVEFLGGFFDVIFYFNCLLKEGIFFINCYVNSFCIDCGIVCIFSGYFGLFMVLVMKIFVKSCMLFVIVEGLFKVGYKIDFLYGGDINFINMKSYLLSIGYQCFIVNIDFLLVEQISNVWGVNDDIIFEYLYNQLRNWKEEGFWYIVFLIFSSYEFFEVFYYWLEDKIFNVFVYIDECLGKFVDWLKQIFVWKDFLVICFFDYGFYYLCEGFNVMFCFYYIFLLWLGGVVKQFMQVDKIMNQIDLVVILLGQFGLEYIVFMFSCNVLGSDYKYFFVFYSFNNGFLFRDSIGVMVFDNNFGSIFFDEFEVDEFCLDKGKVIL